MIFPRLYAPETNQTGELVLLDASSSFANGVDEITQVEIQPITDGDWFDVTDSRTLSWVYSIEETVTATVRINGSDTETFDIEILDPATDFLFSKDSDIFGLEIELKDLIPDGRSSWNFKHREAQKLIIEELNTRGLRDSDDNEITKANIEVSQELNAWSRYLTMSLIYFDYATSQDSVFWEKYLKYKQAATNASNDRKFITLDKDGAGDTELMDLEFSSANVVRR